MHASFVLTRRIRRCAAVALLAGSIGSTTIGLGASTAGAAPVPGGTAAVSSGTLVITLTEADELFFAADASPTVGSPVGFGSTLGPITAGAGCQPSSNSGSPAISVQCSGYSRIVVRALGGNDTVGLAMADAPAMLEGGSGNDTLMGSGHDDVLLGGDGTDILSGDTMRDHPLAWQLIDPHLRGDDYLDGGSGDDGLVGSYGADTFIGGAGRDEMTYHYQYSNSTSWAIEDVHITIGGGTPDGAAGEGDDVRGDIERVYGGEGDDVLIAPPVPARLAMFNGYELTGNHGDDTLSGNNGRDVLRGEAGNDTLEGGAGVDTADGGNDNDRCEAETEANCEG